MREASCHGACRGVGSPRVVAFPGLPRIRTCRFPASYVARRIRCVMLRATLCGEVRAVTGDRAFAVLVLAT
jgi:hypothetical protein